MPAPYAPFLSAWVRGGSVGRRSLTETLLIRRSLAIRGGNVDETESDEESDDEAEEEDEEDDDEEEEDDDNDDIVPRSKKVKPLMLEESPLDKALRAAQSAGQVIGEMHDTLSKTEPIGFLLSNGMFAQLGCSLLLMRTTKKLDYHHTPTLFRIRVFYTLSMAFIQLSYLLIRHAIAKDDDQTEVVLSNPLLDGLLNATRRAAHDSEGDDDEAGSVGTGLGGLAGLLSQGAAGGGGAAGGAGGGLADMVAGATQKTTTVRDYDLGLAKKAAASHFPSMIMMYFFHFRHDWHRAVLFAPIGPLIQCVTDQLFQIYILGRPAEGALSRPFKSPQQRMLENIGAVEEKDQGAAGEVGEESSEVRVAVSDLEVQEADDEEEEDELFADDDDEGEESAEEDEDE